MTTHLKEDPVLHFKLEKEIKIRDAASRIIGISTSDIQRADAEKSLMVASARIFNVALQKQRERAAEYSSSSKPVKKEMDHDASLATIFISKLRVPLIWRNNELFPHNNVGVENYSFFCLVQIAREIKETKLVFDVLPGTVDVEFNDVLLFENVPAEFVCTLEVFMSCPKADSPRNSGFSFRWKRPEATGPTYKSYVRDVSSRSRYQALIEARGREAVVTPAENYASYFQLVGRCLLTAKDFHSTEKSHLLDMGPALVYTKWPKLPDLDRALVEPCYEAFVPNNPSDGPCIPLFGVVTLEFNGQLNSSRRPVCAGNVFIRSMTASPVPGAARRHQVLLCDRCMFCKRLPVQEYTDQDVLAVLDFELARTRVRKRIVNDMKSEEKFDLYIPITSNTVLLGVAEEPIGCEISVENGDLVARPLTEEMTRADSATPDSGLDVESQASDRVRGSSVMQSCKVLRLAVQHDISKHPRNQPADSEDAYPMESILELFVLENEKLSADEWQRMLVAHINEQARKLPQATSLARHGSTMRASMIMDTKLGRL